MINLILLLNSCVTKESGVHLKKQDLIELVYASGYWQPENQYAVSAMTDGFLDSLLVKEGDTVVHGQRLAILEDRTPFVGYQQDEKNLVNLRKAIADKQEEARLALMSAQTQFSLDSQNYVRYQALWIQNACSKIDVDKATLVYKLSKNLVKSRSIAFNRLKVDSEVDLGNAEVRRAMSKTQFKRGDIFAMESGILLRWFKEAGELVRRGEKVAVVGDPRKMKIVITLDEVDIKKVRIGQRVWFRLADRKDSLYAGTLIRFGRIVNPEDQTVKAEVFSDVPLADAVSGLSVEANIEVRKRKAAWVLPSDFVFSSDSVWVKRANGKVKIKIMTGIRAQNWIEVLSGLNDTDLVEMP